MIVITKVEYQLANLISDGERSNQGDGSQEEREEDTRDETRNYPNYLRRSGLEEDFESYPLIVALCWYSGIVRTTHAKNPYADILNVRSVSNFR